MRRYLDHIALSDSAISLIEFGDGRHYENAWYPMPALATFYDLHGTITSQEIISQDIAELGKEVSRLMNFVESLIFAIVRSEDIPTIVEDIK